MAGRTLLARRPVSKERYVITNGSAGTYVGTGSWVTLIAAVSTACDAFEYLNTTGRLLKLAIGSAGNEVEIPHYIMPSQEPHVVPYPLTKGVRISAKAVDSQADDTSQLVFNFYG